MEIWPLSRLALRELIEAVLVCLLLSLALLPAILWKLFGALPDALLSEGGIFESASALASASAAIVFAVSASRSKSRWQTFWLMGLALGCFVLAGEEVSWGQHLFAFEPPAVIAENNFQGEFNLHNLTTIQSHNNAISSWLFRALMAYLILLPLAANAFPSVAKLIAGIKFPVASLSISLAALLIKAVDLVNHEIIYGISFATDILHVGEMVESMYQICIFWLAVEIYLSLKSDRSISVVDPSFN